MILYLLIGVILISIVVYYKRKRQLKQADLILYKLHETLEDYELEVLKDFELYKKDLKVIKFKNGEKYYKITSKFINANIPRAFKIIRYEIIKSYRVKLKIGKPKFFNWSAHVVDSDLLKSLQFNLNSGNFEKLKRFNTTILDEAVNYAIKKAVNENKFDKRNLSVEEELVLKEIKDLKEVVNYQLRNLYNRFLKDENKKVIDFEEILFTPEERKEYLIYLREMAKSEILSNELKEKVKSFYGKMFQQYNDRWKKEMDLNRKLGEDKQEFLGAEFIALRAFNIETLLGFHYPQDRYNHLYLWLKRRKESPKMTLKELEEEYNY